MTSTTVSPQIPAPGWLKTTLLAALVFALCWSGAIAYWRSAEHAPATSELMLALLALPLGLLAAVWLGKKLIPARPTAAAAGTASAARPAAAPPLAILAAALRAPHGDSPETLAAAIADNKARPDLDPDLIDDDGFPVTSARSDAAVDAALQDEIGEWLVLNGLAALRFGAAQWRALTLGTAVIRDLANEAVMQLLPGEGAPPPLRLLALLPSGWTVEQRHAAGLWFRHTVAQRGWPVDSLTRIDAAPDALPAAILGQCSAAKGTHAPQFSTILLACASCIEQETVDAWCANASLQTPARAQGRIPGEGAAGLLLTGLDTAGRMAGAVFAQLHPVCEERRAVSADSAKRADTQGLAALAQRAAAAAGLALSDLACVAADTDHRTSRALELMGFAASALPDLDTTADVVRTGASTGTCGAVPFLCALALAHHAALENNAPALFLSHDNPITCCMALVGPPLAPAQSA